MSVFGAAITATGPAETEATFDWLASRFTGFESAEWKVLSADVSGDLAYVVAIEHTTGSIGGAPAESYAVAGYNLLRREDGEWCVPPTRRPGGGQVPALTTPRPTRSRKPPLRRRPSVVVLDLLSRAGDGFARRLARVQPDQWTAPPLQPMGRPGPRESRGGRQPSLHVAAPRRHRRRGRRDLHRRPPRPGPRRLVRHDRSSVERRLLRARCAGPH